VRIRKIAARRTDQHIEPTKGEVEHPVILTVIAPHPTRSRPLLLPADRCNPRGGAWRGVCRLGRQQGVRAKRQHRRQAVELHHWRPGRFLARSGAWGGLCRLEQCAIIVDYPETLGGRRNFRAGALVDRELRFSPTIRGNYPTSHRSSGRSERSFLDAGELPSSPTRNSQSV
jgi:hypothetical protein